MMKIYAIIVTYNAMSWIDRCLCSLRASTVKVIPIVIDNNSSDGCVECIVEKYPEVILFPQKKNLGFGQANNIGFKYALEHNADYVLLLNQDAALHSEALELMLVQSDGESLLSPLHLNGIGSCLDYGFKRTLLMTLSTNTLFDDLLLRKLEDKYRINMVCAACWLLPRKVLRTIGGFDPLFFHYGEDDNYLHRLQYHGINKILVPCALMYHDREQHGNDQAFYSKIIYRRMLIISANINLNVASCLVHYLRLLKDCYFYYLPMKKYIVGSFLWNLFCVLSSLKKIKRSRSMNRVTTENWL